MNDALSMAVAIGSLSIGLISIAGAWIFKTFRGPNDISADLSAAINKLRDEFTDQRREQEGVARSNGVLAIEVKHLGESVKSLAEEVKGLREDVWRPGPKLAKQRGA